LTLYLALALVAMTAREAHEELPVAEQPLIGERPHYNVSRSSSSPSVGSRSRSPSRSSPPPPRSHSRSPSSQPSPFPRAAWR